MVNIRSDDRTLQNDVGAFIRENSDAGIRPRRPDVLGQALDSGLGFAVLVDGQVCGCSLVYEYDGPSAHSDEIGTQLLDLNHRGLRLQQPIAQFHIIQAAHQNFQGDPPQIFAVVAPDTASEHILTNRVGMTPWTPPQELEKLRAESGTPFLESKRTLVALPAIIQHSARTLLALSEGNQRYRTPKGADILHINVGWPVDEVVRALA